MARKKFQELNLQNAFLFSAALADEETCRTVLEVILGYPITKVRVNTEHSILFNTDFRSIRLDVYARDELEVGYNLEMQNTNEYNLPKRSRYHQGEIDITSLKPGENFNNLKPCIVAFICAFDPFGKGLYRYTFENRCLETDMELGDETRKVFFNTKGKNAEDVPKELVSFLKYVENSTDICAAEADSPAIDKIHSKVKELKKSRRLEEEYMLLGELLDEEAREIRKELTEELTKKVTEEVTEEVTEKVTEEVTEEVTGKVTARYAKLILKLADAGKSELLIKAAADTELMESLFQEYNL